MACIVSLIPLKYPPTLWEKSHFTPQNEALACLGAEASSYFARNVRRCVVIYRKHQVGLKYVRSTSSAKFCSFVTYCQSYELLCLCQKPH